MVLGWQRYSWFGGMEREEAHLPPTVNHPVVRDNELLRVPHVMRESCLFPNRIQQRLWQVSVKGFNVFREMQFVFLLLFVMTIGYNEVQRRVDRLMFIKNSLFLFFMISDNGREFACLSNSRIDGIYCYVPTLFYPVQNKAGSYSPLIQGLNNTDGFKQNKSANHKPTRSILEVMLLSNKYMTYTPQFVYIWFTLRV